MMPPTAPATVLLGEMLGQSLRLPSRCPKVKASVSHSQPSARPMKNIKRSSCTVPASPQMTRMERRPIESITVPA